jgi:hypothetical protein
MILKTNLLVPPSVAVRNLLYILASLFLKMEKTQPETRTRNLKIRSLARYPIAPVRHII